ncbi:sigma-54-dependent Fis family transcriptional regulator [Taibaiella soli]|uniref:Sigma-54 factor interaction domain-containing protein n=1 Tax=Taibaiella soli TaxID=1649169 RepID=A0A2W2ABK3_9BACT|nr:sigma-54-dependent Fis family transcriptional regulator [Taibaiella soli]PZF72691.1 hypothetical protein DN068_12565 [Taibaiella soli]
MIVQTKRTLENQEDEDAIFHSCIELAAANSRQQLLEVITHQLKKTGQFSTTTLYIASEEDQLLFDVFPTHEINNASSPFRPFVRTTNFDVDHRQFLKEDARQQFERLISYPLFCAGRSIGHWVLAYEDEAAVPDVATDTINFITAQLAMATSNVLAREAISRQESEHRLLMELSRAISSIRSKNDLTAVVNNNLKKILDFDSITILLLNRDRSHNAFIFSSGHPYHHNKFLAGEFIDILSYTQNCLDKILESDDVATIDMDQFQKSEICPPHVKLEFENGIKEKLTIPLREDNHYLGVFCVNSRLKGSYNSRDLEMIRCIACQLTVAVSNILSLEEILKRDAERKNLLSFSNAIASVRNKEQLAKVLSPQLKQLLGIDDYVICAMCTDKLRYTPFVHNQTGALIQTETFKKMLHKYTEVEDGIFNTAIASHDPIVIDIDNWYTLPGPPPADKESKTIATAVAINFREEPVAIMIYNTTDNYPGVKQHQLFNSILSQLAIVMSHIMANEKMTREVSEINGFRQQLEEEKIYLKEEIDTAHNYSEIIGDSTSMQIVFRQIAQVAPSSSTVLILGETGTGKELVARAIHNNSPRKNKLMVKVNCAALPANLIESELFGHERGSFTGATDRRIGKFELANGGTLFLDEIGELPPELQVKLLRALQEREIERIGGKTTIKVDIRVIAATNRNLEKEMNEGRFRSDLYYRLNIFPIDLPALRHRSDDIPLLATHFIQLFARKAGRKIKIISNKILQDMMAYQWPGNIRELEHLLERSILLCEGDTLKHIHLPAQKTQALTCEEKNDEFVISTMEDNERNYILQVLKHCKGRVGGYMGAAELLHVPPSTLFSKMKKLGIRRDIVA